jgi:hypothetical protein
VISCVDFTFSNITQHKYTRYFCVTYSNVNPLHYTLPFEGAVLPVS